MMCHKFAGEMWVCVTGLA